MIDDCQTLTQKINGQPISRRQFQKADGRDLFLFGYAPHILPVLNDEVEDLAKGGELRWHPLRQEWNVYAAHRQNRTFKPAATANPLAPSKPGKPATEIPFSDFELAVFENKFTSLHMDAEAPLSIDRLKSCSARGRCEVVVYSPQTDGSLSTLGQEKRRLLIAAWIDRYNDLFEMGCEYVLPFENRGDAVGVTLHHPHGQIYGFPFIPNVQKNAIEAFENGFDLEADLAGFKGRYAIAEADGLIAFCPPYSRFPYEVWIATVERSPGPWAFSEAQQDAYAYLIGEVTRRYDEFFNCPTPYMMSLHAAPRSPSDKFHFTTQFYPLLRAPGRVKYLASVEQSSGVFTVDVMPENAADILKAL